MVFVSFIGVKIKLSYAGLAQWQSNGFVNRRLSVQVTCWAPFGGIVYRLGQLVFNQQSRVQLSVPLPFWGISSVGRTSDLHSEGQEFDSLILHHYGTLVQFG